MSGKAILLVMMGFSLLLMVAGNFWNGVGGRMTDNYVDYFNKTTSHNIAISGANMAANEVFLDPTWTDGYNGLDYQNGKLYVAVQVLDAFKNIRQIISVGIFNHDTSFVKVTLAPSKFSKFAYYSVSEGGNIWWTKKDTVWGPFHTQGNLLAFQKPSFYGKASSKGKIEYYTNKKTDAPYFHGGYEQGVDLPMPSDGVTALVAPAQSGGLYFDGTQTQTTTETRVDRRGRTRTTTTTIPMTDVYMQFQGDYLLYRFTDSGAYTDTVYLPTAAPNGLIVMDNGNIHMQGTISGAYTVGCTGSSSKGTVYLDDDIVYQNNPKTDPTSTDMLGIVAENKCLITDNSANSNDININASIYVQDNGFGSENYASRPVGGNINLMGGIIQDTRQAVGTFSGSTGQIISGFNKQYRYDNRFLVASPPFFPGTGGYEIVSWYE
jgi:hypothetical protein